ncbi:MAG TPA: thioredoxin domain-containing protein [Ktedonobacterales bacterium]|nr:thioredoxin domain-containing protein [Ktedonobacterales bacterium]
MAELTIPIHETDHVRGAETAPVTLLIYGDYECPYTRMAYRAVQRVLADEPDTLRFVFRHFPLTSIHPHAQHASEAAEAAAAQGKFWEMHDTLFGRQHALEDADLARYAQELGLDVERFTRALDAHAYASRIQEDVRSGRASGVQGTPTLYFNGQLHMRGYDDATLRATIARIAADAAHAS